MFSYYTLSPDNVLTGTNDWGIICKKPIGTTLYDRYDRSSRYCHKWNPAGHFALWEKAHTRDVIRMKTALLIEGVPI